MDQSILEQLAAKEKIKDEIPTSGLLVVDLYGIIASVYASVPTFHGFKKGFTAEMLEPVLSNLFESIETLKSTNSIFNLITHYCFITENAVSGIRLRYTPTYRHSKKPDPKFLEIQSNFLNNRSLAVVNGKYPNGQNCETIDALSTLVFNWHRSKGPQNPIIVLTPRSYLMLALDLNTFIWDLDNALSLVDTDSGLVLNGLDSLFDHGIDSKNKLIFLNAIMGYKLLDIPGISKIKKQDAIRLTVECDANLSKLKKQFEKQKFNVHADETLIRVTNNLTKLESNIKTLTPFNKCKLGVSWNQLLL